ncbi:hypothetical protein L226DRAFT_452709 [Lentinus tigrinus ALCF2SS1-7]|nr:hypothetical protein L226DRAFT_452709 [Lentinus tigrinus ALCF2SS1-7]
MQHASPYPQTTPQQASTIQPGSITYTTTVGADGQVVYHPFKAVAASYQTPTGIVNGIQWIPAEATSVLPANATPADANFAASFNRRTDDRNWRDEDYRRRKDDASRGSNRYDRDRYDDDEYYQRQREREDREDRDYRRPERERDRDKDRRASTYGRYPGEYDKYAAADLERRMADMDLERREKDRLRERERDRERDEYYEKDRAPRPRKGSFYGAGERPTSTYQPAPGGNYPNSSAYSTSSTYAAAPGGNYPPSAAYHPPSPRPGDVYPRPVSPYRNSVAVPRPTSPYAAPVAPRPVSPYQVGGAIPRAASPYQTAPIQRAASPYGAAPIQRAASPYGGQIQRAASPYGGQIQRAASPYGGGGLPPRAASPYAPTGAGIYPPGHVLEGQPVGSPSPYAPPINLYANPNTTAVASPYGAQAAYGAPYAGSGIGAQASPRVGAVALDAAQQQQMLSVPEGFNRPPNRAHPYTQFEMMKIGDMDEFLDHMPRMPAVLMPHDVYHEDWIRLMTDLSMAWAGTMPVPQYSPDGRPPKRSTLTADVIDLWNASFFRTRGVEMILYKGRERRSGRLAGTVDMHLPGFDRFDVSSPSESEDTEDDDSADDRDRYRYGGGSGYSRSDTRRTRERKAERKKRKMDKKVKKRMKELERSYAIYLQCVPPTVE